MTPSPVLLALLLALVPSTSALGATTSDPAPVGCAVPGFDDKCESWLATWDGGRRDLDLGTGAILHPDGRTLFVAALECTANPCDPLDAPMEGVVRAIDTATHELRWTARFGPGEGMSLWASQLSLSADGTRLALAFEDPASDLHAIVVVTLDAETGRELHRSRYEGDGSVELELATMGSLATGREEEGHDPERRPELVHVSGNLFWSEVCETSFSCPARASVIASYDAQSGELVRQVIERDREELSPLVASPDGSRLYRHLWKLDDNSYELVAYDAETLDVLWRRRFTAEISQFIAISPDGRRVFRASVAYELPNFINIPVAAHDAETGAPLWTTTHRHQALEGTTTGSAVPSRLVTNGRQVLVGADGGSRPLLIAFDAGDGRRLWMRSGTDNYTTLSGPRSSWYALALSADGATAFAASAGPDPVTAAYDAATGAPRWFARYNSVSEFDTDGQGWPLLSTIDHLVPSHDGRRLYGVGTFENLTQPRVAVCPPFLGCVGRLRDFDTAAVAYDLYR